MIFLLNLSMRRPYPTLQRCQSPWMRYFLLSPQGFLTLLFFFNSSMFRHHSLFSVCHFPRSRLPFWLLLDGRLKWHSNYVRKNRPSKFQMWYIWNFDDFLTKSLVQTPVWQGCYTHSLHSASAVTQLIIGSGTSSLKTNKDNIAWQQNISWRCSETSGQSEFKVSGPATFQEDAVSSLSAMRCR